MSDILEELKNIDITSMVKEAMAETFGKCTQCNTPVVMGRWLRWCPKKSCNYIALRGRS